MVVIVLRVLVFDIYADWPKHANLTLYCIHIQIVLAKVCFKPKLQKYVLQIICCPEVHVASMYLSIIIT